jgi:hypothetical protein
VQVALEGALAVQLPTALSSAVQAALQDSMQHSVVPVLQQAMHARFGPVGVAAAVGCPHQQVSGRLHKQTR